MIQSHFPGSSLEHIHPQVYMALSLRRNFQGKQLSHSIFLIKAAFNRNPTLGLAPRNLLSESPKWSRSLCTTEFPRKKLKVQNACTASNACAVLSFVFGC